MNIDKEFNERFYRAESADARFDFEIRLKSTDVPVAKCQYIENSKMLPRFRKLAADHNSKYGDDQLLRWEAFAIMVVAHDEVAMDLSNAIKFCNRADDRTTWVPCMSIYKLQRILLALDWGEGDANLIYEGRNWPQEGMAEAWDFTEFTSIVLELDEYLKAA